MKKILTRGLNRREYGILDDNRIEFLMILNDSIYCLSLHRQHQRQNNEYIAQKKDTSIF